MNESEEFRNKDFIEDEMIQYCTTHGGAVDLHGILSEQATTLALSYIHLTQRSKPL